MIAGKVYYSLSRYILWHSGKYRFAKNRSRDAFEYLHFAHKTPLLRELKDVEMQYQYNKIVNLEDLQQEKVTFPEWHCTAALII